MKIYKQNNKFSLFLENYKKNKLNFTETTFEDNKIQKEKGFLTIKLDGELCLLHYENGKGKLYSRGGIVREELPLLEEIKNFCERKKINELTLIGELVAVKNNYPLPFQETESIIKTGKNEKNIKFYCFDIISINYKRIQKKYDFIIKLINVIFHKFIYILPVIYYKYWKNIRIFSIYIKKKKYEGILLYSDKKYKIKTIKTLDCCVIGMKLSNKLPYSISSLLIGVLDKNHNIYSLGNIGSGFTRKIRKIFYKKIKENQVPGPDKNIIWCKPFIIECVYRDLLKSKREVYNYKNNKYFYIKKVNFYSLRFATFLRIRNDKKFIYYDIKKEQIC